MNHIFYTNSSVEVHLKCIQLLTLKNNNAMNIVEPVSLWYGEITSSGIAGSLDRTIPNFMSLLISRLFVPV